MKSKLTFWDRNPAAYWMTLAWCGGVSTGLTIGLVMLSAFEFAMLGLLIAITLSYLAWREARTLDAYIEENEEPQRFLKNYKPSSKGELSYWSAADNQFHTVTRN